MTAYPIVRRGRAEQDVDEALGFYLAEAGGKVALGFIEALEQRYRRISEGPAAGSSRYAHELDLPGLRSRALKGYPYLVFYVQRLDHIDVWRVLHAASDIPAWISDEGL
ncbi:type II toxin-antitoxin system RelE/ParE family toxin [Caulobacter segnis]|uniref:Plasmid stabilization protein n=1 Tax=Caulobacter segnis TaxID=88688 RepID=A0A2W5UX49_9CAUL|nr:type II toxin-antitoxin system RelE/ParE family toxin [Caulobacter segnis]PZR32359.1 MAG: plasmid stabilization protein [Caulobacter segnis]